jgi:hypothetical protein
MPSAIAQLRDNWIHIRKLDCTENKRIILLLLLIVVVVVVVVLVVVVVVVSECQYQ